MYEFRIEAKGIEEAKARLAAFPRIYQQRIRDAMQKSVTVVEGAVAPLAPVGVSGRLRGSISA